MTITNDRRLNWLDFYNSSLGKKIITGITGIGLTLFVVFHLLGNLLLLSSRQAYNQLARSLESLGFILYAVELVLLTAVVFHIVVGISIRLAARRSRDRSYSQFESAGTPSKQTLSSRSMAITGIIVGAFLVWHLATFKFGTYYSTTINGVVMRDLSTLVLQKFHNPLYTFGYVSAIALLGLHLRHGIWSAGQSLGILEGRTSFLVHKLSTPLAIVISTGFMAIPLAIYFGFVG